VSDAQLTLFGVYELTASRYEILCGRQGARGVADPALLESFIDATAAYSTTGREAFRRQQEQAICNAARIAGGRSRPGSSRICWRGGWRRSYQLWWSKCKHSRRPIPGFREPGWSRRPRRARRSRGRRRTQHSLVAMVAPFVTVGRAHQA
jgi:hypothetical protein